MTAESHEVTLNEERALRELAIIESVANYALSPTFDRPSLQTKRRSKCNNALPAGNLLTESEVSDEVFASDIAAMELSIGTTIIVSSRVELAHALQVLRPAFSKIAASAIGRQVVDASTRSDLYEQLRTLIQAAFRIGAQATVSTRAEGFVKPKIARDITSNGRAKREVNENAKRRVRLSQAILQVSAATQEGKLINSLEFAGRIHADVRKLLEVCRKDGWPSDATIRRSVAKLLKQ